MANEHASLETAVAIISRALIHLRGYVVDDNDLPDADVNNTTNIETTRRDGLFVGNAGRRGTARRVAGKSRILARFRHADGDIITLFDGTTKMSNSAINQKLVLELVGEFMETMKHVIILHYDITYRDALLSGLNETLRRHSITYDLFVSGRPQQVRIELFALDEPLLMAPIDANEELSPIYRILTDAQLAIVVSKFGSQSRFPRITTADPISRYYGAGPGVVIETEERTTGRLSWFNVVEVKTAWKSNNYASDLATEESAVDAHAAVADMRLTTPEEALVADMQELTVEDE